MLLFENKSILQNLFAYKYNQGSLGMQIQQTFLSPSIFQGGDTLSLKSPHLSPHREQIWFVSESDTLSLPLSTNDHTL